MICGIISACTEYLSEKILFAAPDVSVIGQNYLLSYGGIIAFAAGIILCIASLISKND